MSTVFPSPLLRSQTVRESVLLLLLLFTVCQQGTCALISFNLKPHFYCLFTARKLVLLLKWTYLTHLAAANPNVNLTDQY